ncbi:MAG: hypothetical protein K2K02_03715, partial [Ruminococcus sp.]|nr:hypothetical protein [Ruminococcus sp.]
YIHESSLEEQQKELKYKLTSVEKMEKINKETSEKLDSLRMELEEQKNQLMQREKRLEEREKNEQIYINNMHLQAQKDILEKQSLADNEIYNKKMASEQELEKYIAELKEIRCKELDELLEKNRLSCNERIAQTEKEIEQKIKQAEDEMKTLRENLSDKERNLKDREEKLRQEQEDVNFERELNKSNKNKLNEDRRRLDIIIEEKLAEKRRNMEAETSALHRETEELLGKLNRIEQQNHKFERIIAKYGSDPDVIQKTLDNYQKEINELHTQILNFNQTKADDYDRLQNDNINLKDEVSKLRVEITEAHNEIEESDSLRNQITRLNTKIGFLQQEIETYKGEIRHRDEIINRLQTPGEQFADREQRIKEIRNGHLPLLLQEDRDKYKVNQPENEIDWLTNIENNCNTYGITIPRRILYAFHTALKISDWSTIAVLAGVSGTGKSELPNLYSLFGGINFINVPVQPNWDSQESMLGYFNSIDNRFEAQEILRFLAQCTDDEQYGEYMAIVLLDEMNLAHVELYFAEFLSKLEERRGEIKDNVPSVEVKLGAGIEPYKLKMTRNILWTGTMNQDETTKSLSDKVLDRGIVINFPRPTELKSRPKMKNKNRFRNNILLRYDTWKEWRSTEIQFEGKQRERIEKYREIVNQINDLLEKVGRALGHRVWQSVEYYIANYPTIRSEQENIKNLVEKGELEKGAMTGALSCAMKNAFEDQIVQKIMPKLRGIETSGNGGTQLLAIKALLDREDFNALDDDFDNAMELGYGQFMWNSAKYLEKDESVEVSEENSDNK